MPPPGDIEIVNEPPIKFTPVVGPLEKKKVLVIGSPKSGTTYMAWLLRELGLRVEHERMGEDGTVNAAWLVAKIENDPLFKEEKGRQHFMFDRVIHLVRHPLATIASLRAMPPWPFLRWQYIWTGIMFKEPEIPPAWMLAKLWIWWTDRCESTADTTIRLCDIMDIGPPKNVTVAPTPLVHWEDIDDELTLEALRHRAEKYGW